eukprot:352958-Chlamydomonas_euryale.AAC.13
MSFARDMKGHPLTAHACLRLMLGALVPVHSFTRPYPASRPRAQPSGGVVRASRAPHLQLARARLLVQAFGISLFAHGDGDLHVHLDKLACLQPRAHRVAVRPVRADEADESQQARVREELGDLADAADVLLSIVGAEAQIFVQAVTDVVAVEQRRQSPLLRQRVLKRARHRRLTGAR